ncbi:cytosine permease [Winkia sp. ACRQY]|uniref:purine-cytosine permease family protein n=1 Tax=Winkia sp. ACRQY TaxID=2918182 RepID=UPI001EF2F89E|nr:cytosine permease [Winkia sp. ACRQY]MCG7303346.1 cytosine permease [Winkia sp. ACRQY]
MGHRLTSYEQRGIEPVPTNERGGNPLELFWVWFAANISVLGLPLGVSLIALGLSIPQALFAATLGSVGSFAVVGIISVAGRNGGDPSLTLSRAMFGTLGNIGPTFISLLSRLGWETVNTATAALAFVTFCSYCFGTAGTAAKAPVIAVVGVVGFVALTVAAAGLGHAAILVVQKWATWIFGALNLLVAAFLLVRVDFSALGTKPGAGLAEVLTGIGIIAAGTGIGWVNSSADMARYQRPSVTVGALVLSAAAGAGIPLVIMIGMGALIGGSNQQVLASPNPMEAIRQTLPAPMAATYLLVSIVGLLLSNHLSVYSAGLTTLTLGIRIPRVWAALVDVVATTSGSILFLLVEQGFYGPFVAFISVLAIPIAAWIGIFLVDMCFRNSYSGPDLLDLSAGGKYFYTGGIRWAALLPWLLAIGIGSLFIQVTDGSTPTFTGPAYSTWIGQAGLAWLVTLVLAAACYAPLARRRF